MFLLLNRRTHQCVKKFIFLCLFLYSDVWLRLAVLRIFGLFCFRHNRRRAFGCQFEALRNTADLGCILRTGDHIHLGIWIFVFSVSKHTVEDTVFLGFLCELLQITILDGKDFQFLSRAQHVGESCLAFGFLFFFENRIQEDRNVFCTSTGNPGGNFKSLQAHSDDLFCRFAACVHSSSAPFFAVLHLPVWFSVFP